MFDNRYSFSVFAMKLILFGWVAIGSSVDGFALQANDVETAIIVVKDFESASHGMAITYGAGFFESETNKAVVGDHWDMRFHLARGSDGLYASHYSELRKNNSKGEHIVTSDQQHFSTAGSSVTVRPKEPTGVIRDNIYVAPIVGASLSDRAFFSEILEHESTKRSIESTELNGQDCWVLAANSPVFGLYTFWISKNPELRLIRIEIAKAAQHEIRSLDGSKKKLGDPYPVDRKRLKELPKDRHADYLSMLKDVPSLENEVYCFGQFELAPNGKSFPRLVTRSILSKLANTEVFIGISYSITNIEPFVIDDPLRAEFRRFKIPNGTNATVEGQEGLSWKYSNGRIVRAIDSDAIESLNGVRFRRAQVQYWYYVLFAAILSLSLWIVYRRLKLAGNS